LVHEISPEPETVAESVPATEVSAVVLLPATTEMFAATGAVTDFDPVTAAASVVVVGVVVEPAIRTVEPAAEIAAGADATTVHVADPPTW
jgi:hypothetical protein